MGGGQSVHHLGDALWTQERQRQRSVRSVKIVI